MVRSTLGLRARVVVLVLLVLSPLLVLQMAGVYARFEQRVETEMQASREFAEATSAAFVNYLEGLWRAELSIGTVVMDHGGPGLTPGLVEPLLAAHLSAQPTVLRLAWVSPTGAVLAAAGVAGGTGPPAEQEYFARIVQGADAVLSDLPVAAGRIGTAFVVARAVRQEGRVVGIVQAEVESARLGKALPVERARGATFGLIDRNGTLVFRNTDPDLPPERRRIAEDAPGRAAVLGQVVVSRRFQAAADRSVRMGAFAPIPRIGWAAYATAPVEEVLGAARADTIRETALAAVVAALSLIGALVLGISVAERLRAEAALRESERRFRAIFDRTFQFIWLLRPDGTLLEANQTALDFGGLTHAEVVNRPYWAARWWTLSPETQEQLQAAVTRAAAGEFVRYEVDVRGVGDAVAAIDFSLKPIRDENGAVVLLIPEGRDMTAMKKAQEALHARAAAEERDRARTRFLHMAAHELRNPMAGVKGILSLLRRRQAARRPLGDLGGLFAIMEREVDRLSALLTEMLEAFRVQAGHLELKQEPTDLVAVVQAALQPFRAASDRHRFVLAVPAPGPLQVLGDPGRLEEVVRNLLSNAVKYSPDGGDVCVTVTAGPGTATVTVADQGLGIPADQLGQVFDGFFRASNLAGRDPGGLGLGLYICRHIVQRHGGRIWADSQAGGDTTFFVELPRHQHAAPLSENMEIYR